MTSKENREMQYLAAYRRTQQAIKAINDAIHDLPAPENEEAEVGWAHVGEMLRFAAELEEITERLK